MMKYLLLLLILIVGDIYHAILRCITRALGLFGYLYLLRIPVIVMAVMIAFPLLSWLGPMRALTVGGYEVLDFWHAFFAAIVFVLASGSAYTVALSFAQGTGLRYSGTPFQVSQKSIGWWKLAFRFSILGNVIWMLAASWDSVGEKTAIIAGVVSGLGASWVVRLLLPFFVDLFSAWFSTPLAGLYHRFGAGAGIVRKKSNNTLALELGQDRLHVYALIITGMCVISTFNGLVTEYASAVSAIFLLLAVIIYIGGLLAFALDLYRVPLILFVVAYCTFMTQWRESDHFYAVHHPSSPPGASSSLTPPAPSAAEPSIAEHRYFLQSGSSREYLGLPAQFLGRKGKLIREEAVRNPTARAKPLVVISLAGGGIQAAAWPLAVLERIEGEIPAFHDRVCLISGVSGGSVGAMYYAHACTLADKNPGPFACATEAAQASSLAEVTLAFLGSEFRKVALPLLLRENPHGSWSVLADRGLALEKTFGDNARKCFGESPPYLADATLTSWRSEAFANRMPALIFNGTVAETGERISFSTVPRNTRYTPGTVEFTTRYLGGLNMTTAARLSATFPFVSPAARPAVATPQRVKVVPGIDSWRIFPDGGSCLHVVDGGYFEVSGVIGALAWLEEAMEQLAQVTSYQDATGKNASEFFELPPRIIFLQMSGFPVTDLGAAKDEGGNTSGAIFDLISPVIAAINIRDGVQASFPDELLRVFTKRWGATSTSGAPPQVEFEHIIIQPELNIDDLSIKPATTTGFLPQSPPLSWHLRVSEKLKLQEQVAKTMKSPQIKKLKDSIPSIP